MKSFEAAILELVLDKQKEQYTLILNSLKTEIEKSIQAYEIRPLSDRAIERACYQHMERYSQEIEAQLDVTRSLSKPLNEDRKSTRLNSSHPPESRMPSSA